jgi:hypothetical protein
MLEDDRGRLVEVRVTAPTATPTEIEIPNGARSLSIAADDLAVAWRISVGDETTPLRPIAAGGEWTEPNTLVAQSVWVSQTSGSDVDFIAQFHQRE